MRHVHYLEFESGKMSGIPGCHGHLGIDFLVVTTDFNSNNLYEVHMKNSEHMLGLILILTRVRMTHDKMDGPVQ